MTDNGPQYKSDELQVELQQLRARVAALEASTGELAASVPADRLSMIVFSGSLDRLIAAFVLATSAAATGMHVRMFFTFWGLCALRDPRKHVDKGLVERALGWMLPKGAGQLPLSQLNLLGLGPMLVRRVMARRGFASLPELMNLAAELGVQISACEMSMGVLGIQLGELIDYPGLGVCGATTFVEQAAGGRVSLFL